MHFAAKCSWHFVLSGHERQRACSPDRYYVFHSQLPLICHPWQRYRMRKSGASFSMKWSCLFYRCVLCNFERLLRWWHFVRSRKRLDTSKSRQKSLHNTRNGSVLDTPARRATWIPTVQLVVASFSEQYIFQNVCRWWINLFQHVP